MGIREEKKHYFLLSVFSYFSLVIYLTLFFGIQDYYLQNSVYFLKSTILEFILAHSLIVYLFDRFDLLNRNWSQKALFALAQVGSVVLTILFTQIIHQLTSPVPFSMTVSGLTFGFNQVNLVYFLLFLASIFVFSYILNVSVKSLLHRLTFMTNPQNPS